MRIAIDYTPAVHQGAGIGRYTRGLVRGVVALGGGHAYTLFCAGMADQSPWPASVRVRAVPLSPRLLTILWHRLRLPLPVEVLAGSFDVFHAPDYVLPPLARGRGIVTIHDLSFLRLPECAEPSLAAYLAAVVPRSVRRAAAVLADSESTQRDICTLLDVPPERVHVVYAGVGPEYHGRYDAAARMAVRQRYHLPDAMILFVGTIEPRKNLVRLVEAYACLRRQGITHTLVIAGRRGWREDAVFATVERLGLGDHVLFPGYIPEEDLPIVYSLADLFVFPSLYEGFGLPPLEAMASGVPVVCTATSSLPEVVGDAALTVEATDTKALAIAMERALTMPDLRRELIIRGRARAARFTWEDAAHRVLGIYELVGG